MWTVTAFAAGIAGAFAVGSAYAGRANKAVPFEQEPQPQFAPFDERFDRLVRALPLGVLLLDEKSRIVFSNRAASAIFGFEIGAQIGRHIIEAVPSIELERRVEDALSGESSRGPLIVSGKSGNRTYGVSAYPLTDADDVANGVLVLAEDQTELLAMERARQEFLSNVSHELRTPLSSIKLMLETVIESPDDDVRDLFLPQALGQVDRLANLVMKILEQARAESGQLDLKLERVSLADVVRPIVQSFEQSAQAKNVTLTLRVREDCEVDVDRDRIGQVVVNLLDNALRFTPEEGWIKVDISRSATHATFFVRDNGIGIPYKDLPHVFDRFYVVDRSRARDVSGIGLGLAIVKQVVEAHRGSISAESLLGSGAKFIVELPLPPRSSGREELIIR
ncbi:MAG: cell wall metabolism sensor histidine kinase WalK [Candidatus Eremiobacteraeota bacterium]|nr:cell wall metabolism sensor histidine kinase WalK [Candidatus Eremiobacteraeota bacterium]